MAKDKKALKINTDIKSEKLDSSIKSIVDGNFELAIALYNLLKPIHSTNLLVSPFCLTATLELFAHGAGEVTQQEILKALKIFTNDLPEPIIHEAVDHISSDLLAGYEPTQLGQPSSCRIFTNKETGSTFHEEFTKLFKMRVQGNVKELDFHGKNPGKTIDRWLQFIWTQKDDPNVVTKEEFLSTPNGIVITQTFRHACHGFGGHGFQSAKTRDAPFYVNKKKKVKVTLMEIKGKFSYGYLKKVDAHALILPIDVERRDDWAGIAELVRMPNVCMLCLIPKEKTGILLLEKHVENLSPTKILSDKSISSRSVHVFIPRFAADVRYDLTQALKKLGMSLAFDKEKAKFPEISSTKPFSIIKVLLVTGLSVKEPSEPSRRKEWKQEWENGKRVGPRIYKPPLVRKETPIKEEEDYDPNNSITVRMDHPFMYQVVDMDTNTILMWGFLKDPSDKTNIIPLIDAWNRRRRMEK